MTYFTTKRALDVGAQFDRVMIVRFTGSFQSSFENAVFKDKDNNRFEGMYAIVGLPNKDFASVKKELTLVKKIARDGDMTVVFSLSQTLEGIDRNVFDSVFKNSGLGIVYSFGESFLDFRKPDDIEI